jgi:hypothetical protein
MSDPIVIIGAGLAGLAAALEIEAAGESCLIFESADHLGGKLETTIVEDAYRLDRGFQVLLPSYPELQKLEGLNEDLELQFFNAGARLETDDGALLMANPLQHPSYLVSTAFGEYASFSDKLLVLKLQSELRFADPETLLKSATGTTREYLREYGFSEKMIANFWQPFFSGIFLERELKTSAGFFRYLTRMFAASPVAVPKLGIMELPVWMAKKLKRSEIALSTQVTSINNNSIETKAGKKIQARAVITETAGATDSVNQTFGSVTSFWFKSPEPPYEGAWLSLNSRRSETAKSIDHVAVLSNVSSSYAMNGDALICANVVAPSKDVDVSSVLSEAERLYGPTAKNWKLLREDKITRAFPLYLQRTDFDTPSQQGALERGRLAARQVLERL